MSAHAYTEDQLVEQPAIGLFAEQSAWPNPQRGLPATLLPLGEGSEDAGAQSALPPELCGLPVRERSEHIAWDDTRSLSCYSVVYVGVNQTVPLSRLQFASDTYWLPSERANCNRLSGLRVKPTLVFSIRCNFTAR
jgi:hypothetical protein